MDKKMLTLEDLKKIELDIMIKIDTVCREQGFRYSLCGGSLLGAVRHKGFIPWDDDIDIAMPRPDYEKFMAYCHENRPDLITVTNIFDPRYGYLFGKICDATTVIVEENANRKKADMGVYVDVFPIDGLGMTKEEAMDTFMSTEMKRELLVAANWAKFFKSKTHSWIYEPARFAAFLFSRCLSYKKLIAAIEKKSGKYPYDEAKYVGIICGSYRKKEVMPAEVYKTFTELDFENHKFKAIQQYNAYLTNIYGDYMQLPPVDKQVSHHMFQAWKR